MKHPKKVRKRYEQFVLRIPIGQEEHFLDLKNKIDLLHEYFKSQQSEDEETIKKNAIFIEALSIGLDKLLKKYKI